MSKQSSSGTQRSANDAVCGKNPEQILPIAYWSAVPHRQPLSRALADRGREGKMREEGADLLFRCAPGPGGDMRRWRLEVVGSVLWWSHGSLFSSAKRLDSWPSGFVAAGRPRHSLMILSSERCSSQAKSLPQQGRRRYGASGARRVRGAGPRWGVARGRNRHAFVQRYNVSKRADRFLSYRSISFRSGDNRPAVREMSPTYTRGCNHRGR